MRARGQLNLQPTSGLSPPEGWMHHCVNQRHWSDCWLNCFGCCPLALSPIHQIRHLERKCDNICLYVYGNRVHPRRSVMMIGCGMVNLGLTGVKMLLYNIRELSKKSIAIPIETLRFKLVHFDCRRIQFITHSRLLHQETATKYAYITYTSI